MSNNYCKVVRDYEFIKSFLFEDDELYDRISDDYTDINNFNPCSSIWVGFFNPKCKALMEVKAENAIVLNVHINIPKKYRGENSFKYGNELLKYVEKTCNERFVKINAKIPKKYSDVVRFAIKNGFEKEGVDRMSYIKNGKIYDRVILGKIIER